MSHFKKELNQLQELLEMIAKYWDNDRYLTMSVLIQNAAFHADTWEWRQFNPIEAILDKMVELYPSCHVTRWATADFKMIVAGHFQSEDLEESDNIFAKLRV